MIVSRIQGGLGNQMFQYAYGLYLAERYDTELLLECSHVAGDVLRSLMLDRWQVDVRHAPESVKRLLPRRRGGLGWKNLLGGKRPLKRVREKPFGFHPRFLDPGSHVFLDGYWQSEQFFPLLREQLQARFQPSGSVSNESTAIARRMAKVPAVSLHVRRGDYVQNQVTFETHGTCSLGYYQTCVEELLSRHEELQLFVFSDDHKWCRQHLRFACPTIHVDHNSTAEAHEDLWLMTHCRHHIVANSSFSWWGAWLRVDESGTVYAPERWFRDGRYNSQSIVPATWHKMAEVDSPKQQAA